MLSEPKEESAKEKEKPYLEPDEMDGRCMKKVKYASNKGKNIKSTEISKHDLSKKETLLLLIELSQADSKITFQRNSFGFFDLLGAIGGLKGVLSIVPAMIGSFFSSKFFSAHVADQLYIQKVK